MKKVNLPYHVTRKARGKTYEYFERNGERTRLPDIDAADFLTEYNQIKKHGPQKTAPKGKTWADLIRYYKRTPKFEKLKTRTREDYDEAMEYIESTIGDKDPKRLKPRDIEASMLALRDRGASNFGNKVRSMFSILFGVANRLDWMVGNPAQLVDKLPPTGEEGKPWPPDALKAYEEHAEYRARLIMELCLCTGQRIADVLGLQWTDLRGDAFWLEQDKTDVELTIPFTKRFKEYIKTVKKDGFYIVADKHGRQITYRVAHHAVMKARKDSGTKAYKIHGWRYTAIEQLAEAGCSDDEIMAISGHASVAMVKKYSGPARQRARARRAQRKRD